MKPINGQPCVSWFNLYNVPVWYPWGAKERDAVQANPSLAYLAPPSYKLQAATTIITREPTRPAKAAQTWKEFFAECERINARKLETETPAARETRLNRMRQPPTISARVFEWVQDDDDNWVRQAVLRKERCNKLDFYGEQQKWYDPFWNEWDCCEEFGPWDGDDNDDGYDEDGEIFEDGEINADIDCPPPQTPRRSPSPPPIAEENLVPAEELPEMHEIEHILSEHYGFVLPQPAPDVPPTTIDAIAKRQFLRQLGLSRQDDPVFSKPIGKIALDFVTGLASSQPDPSLWDLARGNHQALVNSVHIKYLRYLGPGLIIFDFGQRSTVEWKIAVMNAADALYICRMDSRYSDSDIARTLLQRGVPFRTFLPVQTIPRPLPSTSLVLPVRLTGYTFTRRDYDAYLHQRAVILSSPGGRAALLRGGYVWRIAIQGTSFDAVLRGPSPEPREVYSVRDQQSGRDFYDDELSQIELDLLCGTYICYTSIFLSHWFLKFNLT